MRKMPPEAEPGTLESAPPGAGPGAGEGEGEGAEVPLVGGAEGIAPKAPASESLDAVVERSAWRGR